MRLERSLAQAGMEVVEVVTTSFNSTRSVRHPSELLSLTRQAEPQDDNDPLQADITPLPTPLSFTTPPSTSRVSTELRPFPSVYSHRSHHDWDDKNDEKDIYAAPTLNRHHSEKKEVGFWRRITPSSWVCRLLLITVVVESLFDLAILVSLSAVPVYDD
jgi:hypothetical protein